MRFVNDIDRATWFTRPPLKTVEKVKLHLPQARVDMEEVMVHERSRRAIAVRVTTVDDKNVKTVQYLR